MSEQDFSGRTFDDDYRQFDPRTPFLGDEKLKVKFYMGSKVNEAKSLDAGREIHDDVEQIAIYVSKDEIPVHEVDDSHRRRWPRQYAAWKATGSNEPGMSGTPLEKLVGISPGQIAELKYQHIQSIERLAEAADGMLINAPGLMSLKAKAQNFLRIASETAPLAAAAEAIEQMKAMKDGLARINEVLARNAELERQVAELREDRKDKEPARLPKVRRKKRRYVRRASPEATA